MKVKFIAEVQHESDVNSQMLFAEEEAPEITDCVYVEIAQEPRKAVTSVIEDTAEETYADELNVDVESLFDAQDIDSFIGNTQESAKAKKRSRLKRLRRYLGKRLWRLFCCGHSEDSV